MNRPWRRGLQDVLEMGGVVVAVEAIVDPGLRASRVPAGWAVEAGAAPRPARPTGLRTDVRHAAGLAPEVSGEDTDGLNAARQLLWLLDLLGVPWCYVTDYSEGEAVVQLLMAQVPVKPVLGDLTAYGLAGAAHAMGVPALSCAALLPDRHGPHDEAVLAGILPLTLGRVFGEVPDAAGDVTASGGAPAGVGWAARLAGAVERFQSEGLRRTAAVLRPA